jgi:hypothetical protein
MLRNFNESLSEYILKYEKTEAKLAYWPTFCSKNSESLKNVIAKSNGYLTYFEKLENKHVIEFGAICKIIPFRTFVKIEGIETIEDKKQGSLHIRQDYHGDVQFMAVSPYFIDKDPLKKIDVMRDPIDPRDFDYNELPNILARFLDHINDWENYEYRF